MSTNTTLVEVVKFTSAGVPELVAQTRAMANEAKQTTDKYTALVGLMKNPAFAKHVADMERLGKAHELVGMKLRNAALASRLADGSEARRLRTAAKLSGEYEKMVRKAEMMAKYGDRWGGVMAQHGDKFAAVGRFGTFAGGAALATVGGLAHRGFEGTVESARFNAEMQMLSRQVAAAFKPLMTIATKLARTARVGAENLDSGGQNALMWGAAGGSALLGARLLGMPVGSWAMSGLRGVGQIGPYSAGGTALTGAARLGGYGFQAYEAYRGVQDINSESNPIRGFGRQMVTMFEKWTGQDFLARNVFGLKHGWVMGQIYDEVFGSNEDNPRNAEPGLAGLAGRAAAGERDRRNVMLAGGGFEEVGSAYNRVNAAIEKLAPGEADDSSEEALGPLLHKLYVVLDKLEKRLGGETPRAGG